jgi:hypothetical protein
MATPLSLLTLGVSGLRRDAARETLEVEDLWRCRNMRVYNGKLETAPGTRDYLGGATLDGTPLQALAWKRTGGFLHLNVATHKRIYNIGVDGTLTDVTRAAGIYTGGVGDLWDSVSFKDLAIFTNRIDPIQKWDGILANPSVVLGGTPPKAGTISSLMTFVLLGNTDEGNGERMIRWSDNGFPELWTGGDSGFIILYQSPGTLMRLLPMGEMAVAYKSDAVHIFYYVGPPFIFGQRQVFADQGLLAPRAVADLGGIHCYLGRDNVFLFNGSTRTPIADKVITDIVNSISPIYKESVVAGVHPLAHEVYFAYTPPGETINKRAWVYTWTTGAWREEDIELTMAGAYRKLEGDTWDNVLGTWDTPGVPFWDAAEFELGAPRLIGGTSAGKLVQISLDTVDLLGVPRDRYLETGLIQPGEELFNQATLRCTLEYLEVELEKTGSHNLELWVGTQEQLTGDSEIIWTYFTIPCNGSKRKLRISKTARYFTFKLRTTGSEEVVRLSGLIAYFNPRGDTQGVG